MDGANLVQLHGRYLYALFSATACPPSSTFSASCWMYDGSASDPSWSAITPASTARTYAGAAALGGKIYICGGNYDGGGHSGSAWSTGEVYDPSLEGTQQHPWAPISNMIYGQEGHMCVGVSGRLYALGGANYSAVRGRRAGDANI